MKIRNKRHYGDPETLKRLKEEADFIGRRNAIVGDCLIVYALPRPKGKHKHEHDHNKRNKRQEKFERRPVREES